MTRLFVIKHLPNFDKKILALFLVCLSISSLTMFEIVQEVLAPPAPGRNSVVTPGGQTTPCTYDVYRDGSTYVAKDCKTGDNAAQSTTFSTLWTAIIASNEAIFFEPAVYDTGGGVSIIDLQAITLWGVYNQTMFQCTTASCAALNIGNPNANDHLYHAKSIYVHDMTFDGGYPSVSNGAGLGITTAFDVDIDHIIVERSGEFATGGFRLTDWNVNQIQSNTIFIHHSLFLGCKITIASVFNGYLEYSTFQGSAPGILGTTALVDFSKCDFTPCNTQIVSNFDFDHNTILGWTKIFMQGFQAINNATVTYNFVQDATGLLNTVDIGGGNQLATLTGLIVAYNTFAKDTGTSVFRYGSNLQFVGNQWLVDTTPGTTSTALSIDSASAFIGPNDVLIQGNQIQKWGGVGLIANFTRGVISGNDIYDVNQGNANGNSQAGILIDKGLSNVAIYSNTIISDVTSGAGSSRPINYNGAAKNITLSNNYLYYGALAAAPATGIFFAVTADKSFATFQNFGYNPVGKITNMIVSGGIGICGTGTTVVTATLYVVCGTDIVWSCTGGTVTAIVEKDSLGNQIFSVANCAALPTTDVYTPKGYSITFTHTGAPTMTVFGV